MSAGESLGESLKQSYDRVPYISGPVLQSHPDRLHVVARLHRLNPAPVEDCRVLELGCASGGNLIPMAAALPGSRFVGIDLSDSQIAGARAAAAELGLDNIRFEAMDMRDFAAPGPDHAFDYVIAHGLYCWIPRDIQAGFMAMVAPLLRPGGLAFVSFNALPGWHQRQPVRDLMLRFTAGIDDPGERAQQARAMFDVLLATCARQGAYGAMLEEEKARVGELPDSFLLHDLMEYENHPRYVGDVIADAAAAGLGFVGEMNVAAGHPQNLPEAVRGVLAALPTVAAREDFIDFWSNRMFRECLFCRGGEGAGGDLDRGALRDFHLASPLRPETPEEAAAKPPSGNPGEVFFRAPDGGRVGLTVAPAIAAMRRLAQAWPASLPFAELAAAAGDDAAVEALAHDLYLRNWIELYPRPLGVAAAPGERPRAFAPALRQARAGEPVTASGHRTVLLDEPLLPTVLGLLDGSRDRAGLAAVLAESEAAGLVDLGGEAPADALDRALRRLAAERLIVA